MNWVTRLRKTIDWAAAEGVKAGRVPQAVQQERIKACRACPKFLKLTAQCSVCGCFMNVKTRLIFDPVESVQQAQDVRTKCPEGIWGEYNEQSISKT